VAKVRDIVGLYSNPPVNAIVLSVDEKSQIQALNHTQPSPPLRPGQVERGSHDYKRHGTTALFAALNVASGQVISQFHARHRSQEFLKFLNLLDVTVPRRSEQQIHLILDNYATHKTPRVKRWILKHPHIHLHFTPTSSSWINLVERLFAGGGKQVGGGLEHPEVGGPGPAQEDEIIEAGDNLQFSADGRRLTLDEYLVAQVMVCDVAGEPVCRTLQVLKNQDRAWVCLACLWAPATLDGRRLHLCGLDEVQEVRAFGEGDWFSTWFSPKGENLYASGKAGPKRWPTGHPGDGTLRPGEPHSLAERDDPVGFGCQASPWLARAQKDHVHVSRDGKGSERLATAAPWSHVAISPDGRWLAASQLTTWGWIGRGFESGDDCYPV
jgi:hypothetical protein